MGKSNRGATWERTLCKLLSNWITGNKNDFIFWRAAGSGSLHTMRRKKGKDTAGQEGDIAAVHPFGEALIKMCSIEAKSGYPGVGPMDLITIPKNAKTHTYRDFIEQCLREMDGTKDYFWLIHRQSRRNSSICVPISFYHKYREIFGDYLDKYIRVKYNSDLELFICELDKFLAWFDPETIWGIYKEEE